MGQEAIKPGMADVKFHLETRDRDPHESGETTSRVRRGGEDRTTQGGCWTSEKMVVRSEVRSHTVTMEAGAQGTGSALGLTR